MPWEKTLLLQRNFCLKQETFFSPPPKSNPSQNFASFLGRLFEIQLFLSTCSPGIATLHEVFGHGYRLRDLGPSRATVEGYHIAGFGFMGGYTEFDLDDSKVNLAQLNAVTVAGIEAQSILATQMKKYFLRKGYIDARLTEVYARAQTGFALYANTLNKGRIESSIDVIDGHDVKSFIAAINLLYGKTELTSPKTKLIAALGFVDPMLWYGVVSQATYLLYGKHFKPPLIKIGSVSYLPNLKTAPAPHGIEYYLENFFVYKQQPIYFYIKWGQQSGYNFYGLGFEHDHIFTSAYGTFGLRGDVWLQPNVLEDKPLDKAFLVSYNDKGEPVDITPKSSKPKKYANTVGIFGSFIYQTPLHKDTLGGYLEAGYKTKGFLPGQSLFSQAVLRGGVRVRW